MRIMFIDYRVRDTRRFYSQSWSTKLWTQSYFFETRGNTNEDVIKAYVQDQPAEHEKKEGKERAWNNLNILTGLFAPDPTISIVAQNHYAPLEIVASETKIPCHK